MKSSKIKAIISVILSLVITLSCFAFTAIAAETAKVVKKPDKTTFYQGIDWAYNKSGKINGIGGDFNIAGTILSYNGKEISYKINKWPNMTLTSVDSAWKVGKNDAKIICDDLPSGVYATLTVNLVAVESISVITPPSKTVLHQDKDWKLSGLGDVEFTEFDMTGVKLRVKYTDNTTKVISYPANSLIGWSVPQDVDSIEPGEATLYAKFCDKKAPFNVYFLRKGARLPGDVNNDYKINSFDALLILQYAVGSATLTDAEKTSADVNKDSKINSADALMILQYAVGKLDSLS